MPKSETSAEFVDSGILPWFSSVSKLRLETSISEDCFHLSYSTLFLFRRNGSQFLYDVIYLLYQKVVHDIYKHSATEEKLTCLHFKFYKSLNDYGAAWKKTLIVLAGGREFNLLA